MPQFIYKVFNATIGFAIGEAYGFPFTNFKKYHAHLFNQKQEMMQGQNNDLLAGTWSVYTAQLLESIKWLTKYRNCIDVHAKELPNEVLEFYKLESDDYVFSRLLPIAFLLKNQPITNKFNWVKQVISPSHLGNQLVLCGFIYLDLIIGLLQDMSFEEAYKQVLDSVYKLSEYRLIDNEIQHIVSSKIGDCTISNLVGNGNVMDILQSVIWVMLQSTDYRSAVHLATGIGGRTDLLTAMVGGLAALNFRDPFPDNWLSDLKNKDQILSVSAGFTSDFKAILV